MSKAFLDCYILVVGAYTEFEKTSDHIEYQIKKIFKYNSLEDRDFRYQNDNRSPYFEIQLPHFLIQGVTENLCEKLISKTSMVNIWYNKEKDNWYIK